MAAQLSSSRVQQQLIGNNFGKGRLQSFWMDLSSKPSLFPSLKGLFITVLREVWELEMSELVELQAKHSELGPQCFESS